MALPEIVSSGYLHGDYSRSFGGEFPRVSLPNSRGWLLKRSIEGTGFSDLIGCYPLFCCEHWSLLGDDLNVLMGQYVSATFVADTLVPRSTLEAVGLDVLRPYKPHYIVDLTLAPKARPRKHRRNIERSLEAVEVHRCMNPLDRLDEWWALYCELSVRHGISGLASFSKEAFGTQLAIPGMVMFEAVCAGTLVGLHLWYEQNGRAYGHLGATNEQGREKMASYALYATAIDYFADRVSAIDLGGVSDTGNSRGLAFFKEGWANAVKHVYLCGKILDPHRYLTLLKRGSADCEASYFPAYQRPCY